MAPSRLTPNERLVRKRLSARLRQRRCRERRRELAMAGVVPTRNVVKESKNDTKSVEASGDNSTAYSSTKSTPTSSPSKGAPVYVDMQNLRQPTHGYGWHYPTMPSVPHVKASPSFHYQHQPSLPPHSSSYYVPTSHHQQQHPPMMPGMYPHPHQYHHRHQYMPPPPPHPPYMQQQSSGTQGHRFSVPGYGPPPQMLPPSRHSLTPTKPPHGLTTDVEPGDVSRTVSRSPSDGSMNSDKAMEAAAQKKRNEGDELKSDQSEGMTMSLTAELVAISESVEFDSTTLASNKKKQKRPNPKNQNSLMSTEKTAVAAMLSMKSSSDESDGDSSSTATFKSFKKTQHELSPQHKQQRATLPLLTAV